MLMGAWACSPDPPPPSEPELRETLGLDDETPIHQILLSGRGDRTRVLPGHLTVRPGDVVQFRVADRRVHRVRFDVAEAAPDVRRFLESTGQASPAPLVERDARLVLTFHEAPPGDYPFVVEGFGANVSGVIRVEEP